MRKDPTEFRARFKAYKEGKMPYENGLPKYEDGKDPIDQSRIDARLLLELAIQLSQGVTFGKRKLSPESYYLRYRNSEGFRKRFDTGYGEEGAFYRLGIDLKKVPAIKYGDNEGSMYIPNQNLVYMGSNTNDDYAKLGLHNRDFVKAHEQAHSIYNDVIFGKNDSGMLGRPVELYMKLDTPNLLNYRTWVNKNNEGGVDFSHDSRGIEGGADIGALGYLLYNDGVFNRMDPKSKITTEQLDEWYKNYLLKNPDNPYLRPIENFGTEKAAWLLNNTASVLKKPANGLLHAKNGKSPIHIKPANRGKFTALKKRTGHSASWFKENGTPAQKKMAVFALNAKKWHHANGKLPEYRGGKQPKGDGTRYLWDDQTQSWDRITDSDVANAMSEWAFTPTTTRAKFDYENTPNPVKPLQKNAVISQDNNAWTKQRIAEESNKRSWLSDAADISHAIGEGAMLASNFAAPEIEPLVYPTYNAFKTTASSVFRQMFSPRPKLEYIDFSAIAQAAAKMKADDAAWNLAHPEMLPGYKPKLPDVYDSTLDRMKPHLSPALTARANIITEPSKNPTVRQIDGFMERFAKMHNDYTDDVKSVYETLIIPRRARAYSAELQTNGVIKINKYLEEAAKDDIDFSAREGLLIAADHGWTFDEIADYNNYRAYADELNKYKTGSWQEYDTKAWELRYPRNKETGGLVVGDYDTNKNRIRTLGKHPLLHESRHRMDNYMPLLDREKKALQDAYGHLSNDSEGFFINRDELVTTNTELRDALLKRLNADKMSLKTQQKILNSSIQLSDEDILGELEFVNSYGSKIVSSIRKKLERYEAALGRTALPKEERVRRLAEKKTEYVDNIRNALMYVGGGAFAIKPITKQITE